MIARLTQGGLAGGLLVLLVGLAGSAGVILARALSSELAGLEALLAALLGTALVAAGAGLLAAPAGIGLALWARWLAPPALRRPAGLALAALGEIPAASLAVALLVLPVSGLLPTWGVLLVGVALVCIPAVAGRALDALDAVSDEQVLQALAVGARPAEAVAAVVLPRARSGLFRAAAAGVSRGLGETVLVVLLLSSVTGQALPGVVVLGSLAPERGDLAGAAAVLIGLLAVMVWGLGRAAGRLR